MSYHQSNNFHGKRTAGQYLLLSTLVMLLLVACQTQPQVNMQATQISVGPELQTLGDKFSAAGAMVSYGIRLSQPFFSVGGIVLTVNGEDLQVFEYPDANMAQQDADNISSDANTINGESMAWIAPPHFYIQGNLIILYIGDNQAMLDLASQIIAEQFAGY